MKVLGIETSGAVGGFAIVDGDQVVAEVRADIMGHHLEKSTEMIESVMAQAGLGIDKLEGVAVSLGPGSFTGLRVGLALAKGLCFAKGWPLAGVPTLDSIAEGLAMSPGLIVPVKDARRGEVYFSYYEARDGALARLAPYRALAPQLVADEIRKDETLFRDEVSLTLVGDGLARYGEVFRSALGDRAIMAPEPLWEARPAVVAAKGLKLIAQGQAARLDRLEPIYVRASEAERQAAGLVFRGTDRNPKNERG